MCSGSATAAACTCCSGGRCKQHSPGMCEYGLFMGWCQGGNGHTCVFHVKTVPSIQHRSPAVLVLPAAAGGDVESFTRLATSGLIPVSSEDTHWTSGHPAIQTLELFLRWVARMHVLDHVHHHHQSPLLCCCGVSIRNDKPSVTWCGNVPSCEAVTCHLQAASLSKASTSTCWLSPWVRC